MLEIEVIDPPTIDGIDIVSVAELASHLRLSAALRTNATWIANMTAAINEAIDDLDGLSGKLNRTVLPRTWKRWLNGFPSGPLLLPYPPLISVDAVTVEAASPYDLDPDTFFVKKTLIPEIHPASTWPLIPTGTRVSVTFKAGYDDSAEPVPLKLKRLVKILAAHFLENPEASINEPRQMMINRKVDFGVDQLVTQLRIPVDYSDWGEPCA